MPPKPQRTKELSEEGFQRLADLKAERKAIRQSFTVAFNKFFEDASSEVKYLQLECRFKQLNANKEEIRPLLHQQDGFNIEEEIKNCDFYDDKMCEAQVAYKTQRNSNETDNNDVGQADNSIKKSQAYRLPKLQLDSFQLTPKTWLPFWAQYQRIYEDDSLDFSDKFQYLLMSLKEGPAKSMVLAHPRDGANLEKAVDALKQRYGRETLLIEIYTREIIAIVMSKEEKSVASLYDNLNAQLRNLEGLGVTSDKTAFILYPLVESCLSPELLTVWERQRRNRHMEGSARGSMASLSDEDYNPLDELMEFLADEVRSEERILRAKKPISCGEATASPPTAVALVSNTNEKSKKELRPTYKDKEKVMCVFCEKDHPSHDCLKAQTMSREERNAVLAEKRACFRCLKRNHRAMQCKAALKCFLCGKRHQTLMCREREERSSKSNVINTQQTQQEKVEKTVTNFAGANVTTYLKTLMVDIVGNYGKVVRARALLDDGAQNSYISQNIVDELKLTSTQSVALCHGLFGGITQPAKQYEIFDIKLRNVNNHEINVEIRAAAQDDICHNIDRPSALRDRELFSVLAKKGIDLTDVGENPPRVQCLLGADVIGRILTGKMQILGNGISAVETKLGWSVLGTSSKRVKNLVTLSLNVVNINMNESWELEAIGISEPVVPGNEGKDGVEDALVHFENTTVRNEGRYEVELPWKPGHPPLPENLAIATKRLESVTAKLKVNGNYEAYDKIFQEWHEEGIIEKVDNVATYEKCHYLAHRPVIRSDKISTKLRPVFDGSAKSPGKASLNDCLCKGANLLQAIPPLLTKFRLGMYGVTSDIKQAFLQLLLSKKDRDVMRFLWWTSEGEIVVYRHCRVVFGISSSPFLLNATISHHLEAEAQDESSAISQQMIRKLQDSFYVDDSVTSFDTREEIELFIEKSTEVMKKGKFELRRWTSSAPWIENEMSESMVLGLKWDLKNDTLRCVDVPEITGPMSKRALLSLISAVYDPMGMLSPAFLPARMLLQDTWKIKLGWDEPLPDEMQKSYEVWAQSLVKIKEIHIPRHICEGKYDNGTATLHVFSDASQRGYGCCIYLRHENEGKVSVQLIAAKSRVAPLQPTTIPRMELLGACVAVRLRKSLENVFGAAIPVVFWTDSMCVLAWVQNALTWGTFVGNRVKEIRNGSDTKDWRHVPGTANPADVASRGCTLQQLFDMKWWEGPKWLKDDSSEWPDTKGEIPEEALKESNEKQRTVALAALEKECDFSNELTCRVGNYKKLLRSVVYIMRFRHRHHGPITAAELKMSEEKVLTVVQRESDCTVKGVVSHIQDGLLRITSRVVSQEDNALIILSPNNPVVTLLIQQTHQDMQHAGVETTLAKLRARFWLIKGRNAVKIVLAKCVVCKKLLGRNCQPEQSALPMERTSLQAAVWEYSGMDVFGPLYLQNDVKVWGIIFTCAVYRCVRIDILESLSTEAFVRALRRFLARNNCRELYSDQGTNFKGLSNQLLDVFVAERQLKMTHGPPNGPWYGGFYERLVGIVKLSLKKTIGAASLTRDELWTIFCECEAVVNARPLTYVSSDERDLQPITHAHFLQENPGDGCGAIELDIIDGRSLVQRIQYVQSVRKQLRERFASEYLSLLVQRSGHASTYTVKVGEVVLIEVENKKRQLWPLGLVVKLFPGKDGVSRVARVRTQQGELVRPLQRLYPLEVKSMDLPSIDGGQPVDIESKAHDPVQDQSVDVLDQEMGQADVKTRAGRAVKIPDRLNL